MPVAGGVGGGGEVGLVGITAGGELLGLQVAQDGVGLGELFREVVAGPEEIAALMIAGIMAEERAGDAERGAGVPLLRLYLLQLLPVTEGGRGVEMSVVGRPQLGKGRAAAWPAAPPPPGC